MAHFSGLRVLRGPDWQGGDSDGGESYLGTVLQLLSNHQVHVLWDMGQESTCRTGQDGKFDLRVFDTAPLGIRHWGTQCAECGEQNVYGILWRCQLCPSCDLCSLCYADDKHDTRHQFLRIDTPGAAGQLQSGRKTSVKIRSIGLHPGAKVVRGRDWEYGDQDGGQGSEGEVIGQEDAPEAPRNLLRVQWPDGSVYSYRLGVRGKVDVTCVEEEVGPVYYRDHLPMLDTTEASTLIHIDSSGAETSGTASDCRVDFPDKVIAYSTNLTGEITHFPDAIQAEEPHMPEEESFTAGDRVAIKVDEDHLQELQKDCGGCTARMLRCIGRTGEVTGASSAGVVPVRFQGSTAKISYRFNPKALLKVTPSFSVNDQVQVRGDVKLLKVLNSRVGWNPAMDQIANKIGRVVKVDEIGDLMVDFRGAQLELSPACCLPVAEATRTPLGSLTSSPATGAEGWSDSAGSHTPSLPQGTGRGEDRDNLKLFRKMRDLMKTEGRQFLGHNINSLFAAIEFDDAEHVRRICEEDPTMVEREHQDLTPLIYASVRGQHLCAEALLDLGADVNRSASDDYRKTPLSAVAEGKSEELAELLLSRGGDTTKLYGDGHTLAHLCAVRNKPVIMQSLVKYGADLNVKDDSGYTPLHLAIILKRHNVMEVLVAAPSVNIHIGDHREFNMIQLAAYVDNPRAMERLLARDCSQVDSMRKHHSTALHIAATNDHVDCVRLLVLQGGADINARQAGNRETSLMIASHRALLQTVEALLELGADVNLCDRDGDTALHLALGGSCGKKHGNSSEVELVVAYRVQIANLLISSGAYVDVENAERRNPFTYGISAVRNGVRAFMKHHPEVVRRKGAETDSLLQSLGVSGLGSHGPGQLKDALKGVQLPCGICGAPKSVVTFQPCGHRCVCALCSMKVTKCPLCDEMVKDKTVATE